MNKVVTVVLPPQKEGELDENEGMSWNWNSGYKFYVQNGSYFDSDSLNFQPLKLHIGLDQYINLNQLQKPLKNQ